MESRSGFIPIRWPNPKTGPFEAQVRLAEVDGRYEVVELTIGSVKDNQRITGTVIRGVPVAEFALKAATRIEAGDLIGGSMEPGVLLNADVMDAEHKANRERVWAPQKAEAARVRGLIGEARRRYTADHFKAVAVVYNDAVRVPPHKPTKAVAEAFGLSPSAAAKHVSQAREKGLLKATTPGKAAGPKKSRKGSKS
jgi:hypothetical protein